MKATLNIWLRDRNCSIIEKWAHLHIYNCHDQPVIPWTEFTGGHIEVKVPPGCYLVTAGVEGGNIYTDMTMVIVRCGDDACVNLVLNDFERREAFPVAGERPKLLPPIQQGCGPRIGPALIANAAKQKINVDEVRKALGVIYRAAKFDEVQAIRDIEAEIKVVEKRLEKNPPRNESELKAAKEYLQQLKAFIPQSL